MLQSAALLRSVDVLALEASGPLRTADAVRMLHREQPGICIVLVGGGLTQDEIAEAFRAGAFDYFPNPEESDLLAERLHSLCNRYRRERSPLAGRTARNRTVVRQGAGLCRLDPVRRSNAARREPLAHWALRPADDDLQRGGGWPPAAGAAILGGADGVRRLALQGAGGSGGAASHQPLRALAVAVSGRLRGFPAPAVGTALVAGRAGAVGGVGAIARNAGRRGESRRSPAAGSGDRRRAGRLRVLAISVMMWTRSLAAGAGGRRGDPEPALAALLPSARSAADRSTLVKIEDARPLAASGLAGLLCAVCAAWALERRRRPVTSSAELAKLTRRRVLVLAEETSTHVS